MCVAFARGIGDGRAAMRRPLSLVLILCLAFTGIGLGAARGTVMAGGQVVICTGQGVVVMDHPGAPGPPHLCPDMALSLLAAVWTPPPQFGRALPQPRPVARPQPLRAHGRESPRPAARGPPALRRSTLHPV